MFDLDSLTLGEIARVEDISRMSIKRFSDPDAYIGRMTAALAYVVKRRTDPAYQFDQALDLTQAEVNELLDLDGTAGSGKHADVAPEAVADAPAPTTFDVTTEGTVPAEADPKASAPTVTETSPASSSTSA